MVFAVEAFVPTGVTNYSYKNRQNYQCSSFSPLSQGTLINLCSYVLLEREKEAILPI